MRKFLILILLMAIALQSTLNQTLAARTSCLINKKHAILGSLALLGLGVCGTATYLAIVENQPKDPENGQISSTPIDPSPSGFEGWGTSLSWEANTINALDPATRKHYLDLVFDSEIGLGLNVIRYNIGGGENPNPTHYNGFTFEHIPGHRLLEGFQPEAGVWNWQADSIQRSMLLEAQSRGANVLEAFSNSPPYWMTKSKCASGSYDTWNNLDDTQYEAFADYLTEVVKTYQQLYNITFTSLSAFNEPTGSWWRAGGNQEGCYFGFDSQNKLLALVDQSLKDKGLNHTVISATEEYDCKSVLAGLNRFDNTTLHAIGKINTHGYDRSECPALATKAEQLGKKIWMSEWGCCFFDTDPLTAALQLAVQIRNDLTVLRASAWVIWQPSWGIISSGPSGLVLQKQFYALLGHTRFIRPGYHFVGSNDFHTLASLDSRKEKLILVSTNDGSTSLDKSFKIPDLNFNATQAKFFRTSDQEDLVQLPPISLGTNSTLNVTLIPHSINTFVIEP